MSEGNDHLFVAILLEKQGQIEKQKIKISKLQLLLQKYKQQIVELKKQKNCDQESVIMVQQKDQVLMNKDNGTSQFISSQEQSEEESAQQPQFIYPPNNFQRDLRQSPSKCGICQKEYVTQVNLQTHMRIIHKLPKKDKKTKV